MTQITTYEPQSVIIFFDGMKKFLPTDKANKLYDQSSKSPSFTLDGGLYKFSAISKIIPAEDYYLQNPDERPSATEYFESPSGIEEKIENYTPSKRVKVIKMMMEGMNKFISEFDGDPSNAIAMKGKWEDKIKMVEAE